MQQVIRKEIAPDTWLTCLTTSKFKRAVLRVAWILPLGGEQAALRAVLPYVLRRGSRETPDLFSIGCALDRLYGARIEVLLRREGENLAVGLIADCIDEHYAPDERGLTARMIQMLCAMLYDPYLEQDIFAQAYTEGERDNLLDRMASLKDDPRQYAPWRLVQLMCAHETFGNSQFGTEEQARAITPQALYQAYREVCAHAKIELFYCGTQSADAVADAFARALPVRDTQKRYRPYTEVVSAPRAEMRTVVECEPVGQDKLSIGFRTGGASLTAGDEIAYRVFQTLYGGSTSSRLFVHVREKQSLCYDIHAGFLAHKGILQVNAGIESEKFDQVREEILRQLQACACGELTEDEVAHARHTLQTSWYGVLDNPISLEAYWLGQAVAGTHRDLAHRLERIACVTRKQVIQAAEQTKPDMIYLMKGART